MDRWAAIAVLALLTVSRAFPQLVLKSTSRVVQIDVLVVDASGNPVHGLQQKDFAVTDNGHARDIQIFAGETDADETAPRVFSNRLGLKDSRIVTALVIDAVRRPDSVTTWRGQAQQAIERLETGQTMAIYAVCPDLRVVQDYTSDPERLLSSLKAFVLPRASSAASVDSMLAALREIAGRMSGSSGRKSIVWMSQGYGAELSSAKVRNATDATVAALNDVNAPLYAVDARFDPTCLDDPLPDMSPNQSRVVTGSHVCSQPADASDDWMKNLAQATGGRAFTLSHIDAFRTEVRNVQGRMIWGEIRYLYKFSGRGSAIDEALRFAVDDSRYAYELGFYVPEPELDGKLHTLAVTLPGKPKYGLRYRSGYTASARVDRGHDPASAQHSDEVGVDATIDVAAAQHELRVSLALDPATVTRTANGGTLIDETFLETDDSGRQLAKIHETVPIPAPEAQDEMLRYTRSIKLARGAALLHITVRDPATKRAGSVAIPIGKQ